MPYDWVYRKCDATPIPTHQEQSEFEQNLKYRSIQLDYPYTFTLILALPAAAFMVRLFILFHDCVHGSFFRWQKVSTLFGYFLGVFSPLLKTGASPAFDITSLAPTSMHGDSATFGP